MKVSDLVVGETYVYDDGLGRHVVFLGFHLEGTVLIRWVDAPGLGASGVSADRLLRVPTRFTLMLGDGVRLLELVPGGAYLYDDEHPAIYTGAVWPIYTVRMGFWVEVQMGSGRFLVDPARLFSLPMPTRFDRHGVLEA